MPRKRRRSGLRKIQLLLTILSLWKLEKATTNVQSYDAVDGVFTSQKARGNDTALTDCKYRVIVRHSLRTKFSRVERDVDAHNHEVCEEDDAALFSCRKLNAEQEEEVKNM